MNFGMLGVVKSLFDGIFGTVKEIIPDKDKQAELITALATQQLNFQQVLIQQTTLPWVDATVKLLYTLSDLLKQHWRPLTSAFVFLWGLLHPEEMKALMELGTAGEVGIGAIFSSFPGWMLSRHLEKKK